MSSPDIWVGTRAQIADHVLSMANTCRHARLDPSHPRFESERWRGDARHKAGHDDGREKKAPHDSVRNGGADVAQRGDGAARSGRSGDPADRGRHRADADDEGRRVPADAAGQPAGHRAGVFAHHRDRRRRAAHRRDGDVERASSTTPMSRRVCPCSSARCGRFRMCACAMSRASAAISRTAIRTWICRRCWSRSARGFRSPGPSGERELPVEELYAGYYETVLDKNELITAVTVPAHDGRGGLCQSHLALGRRLAGARRRRVVCA